MIELDISSDEMKLGLFGCPHVACLVKEPIVTDIDKNIKPGGVGWGCFSLSGTGNLVRL